MAAPHVLHNPAEGLAPRLPDAATGNLGLLLDLCFDPACLLSADGHVEQANRLLEAELGSPAGGLVGTSLLDAFDPLTRLKFRQALELPAGASTGLEAILERRDGQRQAYHIHIGRLTGHPGQFCLIARPLKVDFDKDSLECKALHDALTGLPNRTLFLDRLAQAAAHARRWRTNLAVFFIDLDGFKPINDVHGHECGDHVLVVTARRIEESLRAGDSAARIGGDEFVVVLGELREEVHAGLVAGKVIRAIAKPIPWGAGAVAVNASLGISLFPNDAEEPETLLRMADEAMYKAKRSGKNGYVFYDESRFF